MLWSVSGLRSDDASITVIKAAVIMMQQMKQSNLVGKRAAFDAAPLLFAHLAFSSEVCICDHVQQPRLDQSVPERTGAACKL